eukprot:gene11148-13170_t
MTRIIKRFRLAGKECLVIKYAGDTRYDDVAKQCVVTHDNQSLAACPARMLADLNEEAQQYDVIGVDEGQFFPDVVEFAERWANNGKIVVIAALDGTFQRKAFNNILELVPLAEKVTKLTAVCNICSQDAPFSKRLGGELEVEVRLHDGFDAFAPLFARGHELICSLMMSFRAFIIGNSLDFITDWW